MRDIWREYEHFLPCSTTTSETVEDENENGSSPTREVDENGLFIYTDEEKKIILTKLKEFKLKEIRFIRTLKLENNYKMNYFNNQFQGCDKKTTLPITVEGIGDVCVGNEHLINSMQFINSFDLTGSEKVNYILHNGNIAELTKQQMQMLYGAQLLWKQDIYTKEATLSYMVNAATTLEEVEAIKWE